MDAPLIIDVIKAAVVLGGGVGAVPVLVWLERKGCAWIQERTGPNRVGPYGIIQPFADVIKLLFKEDITPASAHKVLYTLAPFLSLTIAVSVLAVIPFGDTLAIPFTDYQVKLIVADVDVGILWVLAMASLMVYGIILAGWASANHYSFMGGLRSSAQIISYELGMGFAIISVLLATGSLRLREVVLAQEGFGWHFWTMPLAFVIFWISIFAETNRLPFDLPEAESELVVGFHTEYSSMKFSMFFMAEYVGMVSMSSLLVTLFFGGWKLPGLYRLLEGLGFASEPRHLVYGLADVAVFVVKTGVVLFIFIWVRWTLPRFRYDQLMALGWKAILPLSIVQVFLVSIWKLFGPIPYAVATALVIVVVLVLLARPRRMPVDSRYQFPGRETEAP